MGDRRLLLLPEPGTLVMLICLVLLLLWLLSSPSFWLQESGLSEPLVPLRLLELGQHVDSDSHCHKRKFLLCNFCRVEDANLRNRRL